MKKQIKMKLGCPVVGITPFQGNGNFVLERLAQLAVWNGNMLFRR